MHMKTRGFINGHEMFVSKKNLHGGKLTALALFGKT